MATQQRRSERGVAGFLALGLLLDEPASGYELAARAERTVAHFWPVTRSALYAELPRLAERGWLDATTVVQSAYPDKRIYSVTAGGRAAFLTWLTSVEFEEQPRHPLQLLLFFTAHAPDEHARRLLDRWAQQAERAERTCRDILQSKGIDPDTAQSAHRDSRALTALFGLRRAQADRAFVDEARAALGLD